MTASLSLLPTTCAQPSSFSHTHTHTPPQWCTRPDFTLPRASDSRLTFQDCIPEVCFLLIFSGNLQCGCIRGKKKSLSKPDLCLSLFLMSFIRNHEVFPGSCAFRQFYLHGSIFFIQIHKKPPETCGQTMRNPYGFNQKDFSRLASGQQAFRLYA